MITRHYLPLLGLPDHPCWSAVKPDLVRTPAVWGMLRSPFAMQVHTHIQELIRLFDSCHEDTVGAVKVQDVGVMVAALIDGYSTDWPSSGKWLSVHDQLQKVLKQLLPNRFDTDDDLALVDAHHDLEHTQEG